MENSFCWGPGGDDNEDTKSGDTHSREDVDLSECSQHLYEPISEKEVSWALNVVKKDAALAGLDGVVMEIMLTERLLEVWVALFRVCWERERVPTMCRENCCCACTKEASKGCVCEVNTFRGISLTSMISKVPCKILENRLLSVVEEKGLYLKNRVASEKGEDVGTKFFLWYCWDKHRWSGSQLGRWWYSLTFLRPMIKWFRRSCGHVCRVWAGKFLRFLQALQGRRNRSGWSGFGLTNIQRSP